MQDNQFTKNVRLLKDYLSSIKAEFDEYDRSLDDPRKNEKLLLRAKEIFSKLDSFFHEIWNSFSGLSGNSFLKMKKYYENELYLYLGEGIETNTYIRQKPLGYAGDFVTMNYIYEYFNEKFLGSSCYSKLINRYTCNINVAKSNIARKDYIKKIILETLKSNESASILSVGCGPARELIELLRENKIEKATIHLLDLEKKAILYVQNQLELIAFDRSKINIHFHMMDLMEVVKNNRFISLFPNIDLLYASGVFDYLSNRVAKRVFSRLCSITKKDLIVFNMSLENAKHRAYYEVFGDWVMYHRCKEELLEWSRGLKNIQTFSVESPLDCNSYWILKVRKE